MILNRRVRQKPKKMHINIGTCYHLPKQIHPHSTHQNSKLEKCKCNSPPLDMILMFLPPPIHTTHLSSDSSKCFSPTSSSVLQVNSVNQILYALCMSHIQARHSDHQTPLNCYNLIILGSLYKSQALLT